MNVMPWGIPGGENVFGYTAPYGCYEKEFTSVIYNYHLQVTKSLFSFIPFTDSNYIQNFDLALIEDSGRNGYFATLYGENDQLLGTSPPRPIEINNDYTNIPPVQKLAPPPATVDCLLPQNARSCISECIRCPEPPSPDFIHPPVPALWKGSGVKLHINLRIKGISFQCGWATTASAGIITCHQDDLASEGARIEGLHIEYDLIPALLITADGSLTNDRLPKLILPSTIPSPPYRPFLLIRNLRIHDIAAAVLPCVPNWMVEEALESAKSELVFKWGIEDSYQIDLQSMPEWGTYYFTENIYITEDTWPEHKTQVDIEYLPGLRDN